MRFIAVNGENYRAYTFFADKNGWPLFTQAYLHTWIGRRRVKIQNIRRAYQIEVRKTSMLDKEARVNYLEEAVRKLDRMIEAASENWDLCLRLLEQQRKHLQAIAQERGEWNAKPEDRDRPLLLDGIIERMEKRLSAPDVIEGEVTDLSAEA